MLFAADLPAWLVRLFAFTFGALWGSFFNVAIYRWPLGMSVVKPPSHCPSCGAPVRWYLNVPIVGYALLGGKARCCGAKLTPRYVWVELLTAVLFLAVAERIFVHAPPETEFQHALVETLLYCIFVGGLIIATFVDLEWMEIPDEVSLPGAALGLATVTLRVDPGPVAAALGAGLGFLIIQVPFVWLYEIVLGRRGMGEGDPKFLAMIGAFLGWEAVLFSLVAGSVQGLIVYAVSVAFGISVVPRRPDAAQAENSLPAAQLPLPEGAGGPSPVAAQTSTESGAPHETRAHMPFGPMLALSALEYLLFGPDLVQRLVGHFAN